MTSYSAEQSDIPPAKDMDWSTTTTAALLADSSTQMISSRMSDCSATAFLPFVEFEDDAQEELSEEVEVGDGSDAMQKLAADITKAVVSGNAKDLTAVMRTAYDACGGDPTKVAALGAELSKQLEGKGFDVKSGGNHGTIAIHKHGADKAVSFELAKSTRAGLSPFREQTYDWVTKKDLDSVKPETVMADFGKPGDGKGLKDATELAKLFDKAASTGDFSEANRELARSARHAYEARGAAGVKELESSLGEKCKSENKPLLDVSGDKLTIYQGKVLTSDEAATALENGGLKQAGIIKDSSGRYLKPTTKGLEIDLPAKKK
ncbi:MAG: hypothetical protein K2X93_06145 [Candidatus Obscuribacterales bacterium]|nr:hypothetical protein [Candidatus Obscuribacterales bacterium]